MFDAKLKVGAELDDRCSGHFALPLREALAHATGHPVEVVLHDL
jgi:hypothetical protein